MTLTRKTVLIASLSLMFVPLLVHAQGTPPKQTAVRIVDVVRLADEESVRLDGVLDEPVWQRTKPAADFVQRDPDNGMPATERTEVRLLHDADRLILGVTLDDGEPSRVLGNQMQRDQSFQADDRFMWTIDTFLDGRSGYFFEINPSGAMGDGLIEQGQSEFGGGDNMGAGINKSWDGIWMARVRRTASGWTAEIEIPFRTLNFDPNAGAWGVNFQRTVRRKNEESLWSGHAYNQGLARMSNAGQAVGFRDLSQGIGLDVKPYVVGNVSSAPGRGRSGSTWSGDVGADAFYNLTPALRANLSVNTDFAETEVDQRRVNLTRFPLFFEEKRDFFLEGSGFFDFSRESGDAVVPFFSRRIGLDERGTPQRIDVGAKLTGQAGAFDIGVLQVRTGEGTQTYGEDFSVLRVRRRVLQQSYVGALYTRRSGRVDNDVDRHTGGLDFALQTSTFRGHQNVELSGFYLWTSNPDETGQSSAYGLRASYPNDPVVAGISIREIQPNYDPAVGFVERRGYRQINPSTELTRRLDDHPWIRAFEFEVNVDIQTDLDNRLLTRELGFTPLEVQFEDGARVAIDVARQYERLEEDFEISDGIVLPVDSVYEFTRYDFQAMTADHRMVSGGANVGIGDFFSGRRREYSLQLDVRPRRGVALTFEGEHNVLDLAEGSFGTDVFRTEANTQVSPWLSLVNNLQYDTVSRQLGWQMRLRWIRRPGNDLYVVYTHNWRNVLELDRFQTLDRRAAAKMFYTLRF